MKDKPYKVTMHTFIGSTKHDDNNASFTYEITFNQSLVHTGRFKGIEDGLNSYRKKEKRSDVIDSFKSVWCSLKNLFT